MPSKLKSVISETSGNWKKNIESEATCGSGLASDPKIQHSGLRGRFPRSIDEVAYRGRVEKQEL